MARFSTDGIYFAQLSTDGKLNVWETATNTFKQEFTPDFHLTSPCTCLHFLQAETSNSTQNGSPKKKVKRKSLDFSAPFIALGTSSGLLLVYSIANAKVEFTINSDTSEGISCLSWEQGSLLYSGANQYIVVWNTAMKTVKSKWKAGNEKIFSVLALPRTNRLLSAARSIKLWDVDQKTVLKTFTGHSSEVNILQYINPGKKDAYFISGAIGDRLLSCWNISEKSREKNSIASFLMEDIANNISVLNTSNGSTSLAACTRSGVVHIYDHTLNGKCLKPLKPQVTLQVASDTGQSADIVSPITILGVMLKEDGAVLIGHGISRIVTFETVIPNTFEKVQCLIRNDPKRLLSAKGGQVSKTKTPIVDNSVEYLTPSTSSSLKLKRKNDGSLEVPMEKRLENLTLNKIDSSSAVPKNDNVAQLLIQGLHSQDKTILRNVLYRKDENVIRNTVKRLPLPAIVPLIEQLTEFIQGKTLCCQIGSMWLRQLLQCHAGLLVSNPELATLLGPLLAAIESRVSLMAPLSRLRGRLDLLVSQCTSNSAADDDTPIESEALVYKDQDSSDSEDENIEIQAPSDSDIEWVEESSEGDGNEEDIESDDEMSSA